MRSNLKSLCGKKMVQDKILNVAVDVNQSSLDLFGYMGETTIWERRDDVSGHRRDMCES